MEILKIAENGRDICLDEQQLHTVRLLALLNYFLHSNVFHENITGPASKVLDWWNTEQHVKNKKRKSKRRDQQENDNNEEKQSLLSDQCENMKSKIDDCYVPNLEWLSFSDEDFYKKNEINIENDLVLQSSKFHKAENAFIQNQYKTHLIPATIHELIAKVSYPSLNEQQEKEVVDQVSSCSSLGRDVLRQKILYSVLIRRLQPRLEEMVVDAMNNKRSVNDVYKQLKQELHDFVYDEVDQEFAFHVRKVPFKVEKEKSQEYMLDSGSIASEIKKKLKARLIITCNQYIAKLLEIYGNLV